MDDPQTAQRQLSTRAAPIRLPKWYGSAAPGRAWGVVSDLLVGRRRLAGLGPAVTVVGSGRPAPESTEYAAAEKLGYGLATAGYAVVTGGGSGLMAAANKGAQDAGGRSLGLGIVLPRPHPVNPYVDTAVAFHTFAVRKAMFLRHTQGMAVLPGGVGTLDELFEVLALTSTSTVTDFPVVLLGTWYWSGLLEWLAGPARTQGKVSSHHLALARITDDVEEAVAWLGSAAEPAADASGPGAVRRGWQRRHHEREPGRVGEVEVAGGEEDRADRTDMGENLARLPQGE
ncbi:TIGR00730 family Rossman fold protein [Streptomyces natalensis]|uniref:LOG family protein n=1 Tax=Streptomyces natalensis TaxID=68242 RepID=UPI0012FF2ECD|nr:TIGR00730 family Rossman fold protein [Streptomyces natalensis]